MRLLDRLVIRDLIGPYINGMLMFLVLVFTAGFLFKATDMVVQGVPVITVLKFVLYALPSILTQTFPMAMLLASLMAFGRLSSDREVVAIFASGISFLRAIRPVLLMGVLVSVAAFAWDETVVPPATTAMWNVEQEAVSHLARSDQSIIYNVPGPNGTGVGETVKIEGGYDARTRTLRYVTIIVYSTDPARHGAPDLVVYCDKAQGSAAGGMDQSGLNWTYYNGYVVPMVPDRSTGRLRDWFTPSFATATALPRGATIGKTFDEVMHTQVTDTNRENIVQLRARIIRDRAAGRELDARGEEVDLYGKVALPLASAIFGIVGASLGLSTQRGGSKAMGFGVAIFIVFLYWVFYHAMFVVGKNGSLPPMIAAFLADVVGAAVGVLLVARASR